uniref:Putative LOC100569927 [Acyrthosiphon pisum] n=1 Tax=Lepeophtheirus salmonis TaxID=72036 RepID=A0A0K2TAD6_LEPSM
MKRELENRFTKSQCKLIISGKRFGKWDDEDFVKGMILKSLSSKAYRYIQCSGVLPDPSVTTLKRWIRNFKTAPGIRSHIIKIITQQIKSNDTLNG